MLGRMCFVAALIVHPAQGMRLASSNGAAQCWDTSHGLVNEKGWGCEIYRTTPNMCGMYDGNGFISMDMCCACNGGYWEEVNEEQHKYDHSDPCLGYTCDQWIEWYPTYTCSYLSETFGCDCSTSSCITNCPATCNGNTCDELIDADHSLTCGLLQHTYGCDCHGCECKVHEVALTDGYSLLTHEETGASGDCMKKCIGCDHTWLPHNVHTIQSCRALCDENYNDEGIEKLCYAYSWDDDWSTCRLYHDVPDGPTNGRFEQLVCYVKAVQSLDESYVNAQIPTVDATTHAPTDKMADGKDGDQQKIQGSVETPRHGLGLVNSNLWAHYAMTTSLTFKITNTFSEPSACVKNVDVCFSNNHIKNPDVLTFEKRNQGMYSRHTVISGGGDFGTSQKYALFKPNVVNKKTTWRVADPDNDHNIHFTIQKGSSFKRTAWNVYHGHKKDNDVEYYAVKSERVFWVYKSKLASEAIPHNWSATVSSVLPTESNGHSVLSVIVTPGEDTTLLLLTAWAIYHSGDSK